MQLIGKDECFFGRWRRDDATGKTPPPIEWLVIDSLRYLGRGLTFDDIEEYTTIIEDVNRFFFTSS